MQATSKLQFSEVLRLPWQMGANCYYHLPFRIPSLRVTVTDGRPRFIVLRFMVLHRSGIFYKLKTGPSTTQKRMTHFIAVVRNQTCNTEECLQCSPCRSPPGSVKHGEDGLAILGAEMTLASVAAESCSHHCSFLQRNLKVTTRISWTFLNSFNYSQALSWLLNVA